MSVDSEPTVPDESLSNPNVVFTYGIFKTKEGIPFLAVVPFVNGKPVLNRVLPLTEGLEEFQKLYEVIRQIMEGNSKRPTMYD